MQIVLADLCDLEDGLRSVMSSDVSHHVMHLCCMTALRKWQSWLVAKGEEKMKHTGKKKRHTLPLRAP